MKISTLVPAVFACIAAPSFAFAQDAGPVMDKGDVAWMMTATLLVLFMLIPGLALFYGGLVRTKNMLSVLMQCTVIAAMVMVDLGCLGLFICLWRRHWSDLGRNRQAVFGGCHDGLDGGHVL